MPAEDRPIRRQRITFSDPNDHAPLVLPFTVRSKKQTPASANITIFKAGTEAAVQASAAMTVNGTLLEFIVDTTIEATWELKNGYRAEVVVTFGGKTYPRTFLFDVVRFVLVLNVTVDQLIELDDSIAGMEHAGDESFTGPINAAKDLLQSRLEAKIVRGDKKMLQDMALDYAGLELVVRYWSLAQIWLNKNKDAELHDLYQEKGEKHLSTILSTLKFDDNQTGEESSEPGGIQETRLIG